MTDEERRANLVCDDLLRRAARSMVSCGAGHELVVDRVMTFGVAMIVADEGRTVAAQLLRGIADNVAAGAFDRVDPTSKVRQN